MKTMVLAALGECVHVAGIVRFSRLAESVGWRTVFLGPATPIKWKAPYPIIRHHFGLPTLEATTAGIGQIADARVLDVISLGIDQDAQSNFFHPERQNARRTGAGGVPVRTSDDYRALYNASRRGNYPLLRTYSGTDDFIRLAEMYMDTIHIAWAAVPLYWFNQMDGRGPWDLEGSIREHQKDYWQSGRTLHRIGLADISIEKLTRFVNEGFYD